MQRSSSPSSLCSGGCTPPTTPPPPPPTNNDDTPATAKSSRRWGKKNKSHRRPAPPTSFPPWTGGWAPLVACLDGDGAAARRLIDGVAAGPSAVQSLSSSATASALTVCIGDDRDGRPRHFLDAATKHWRRRLLLESSPRHQRPSSATLDFHHHQPLLPSEDARNVTLLLVRRVLHLALLVQTANTKKGPTSGGGGSTSDDLLQRAAGRSVVGGPAAAQGRRLPLWDDAVDRRLQLWLDGRGCSTATAAVVKKKGAAKSAAAAVVADRLATMLLPRALAIATSAAAAADDAIPTANFLLAVNGLHLAISSTGACPAPATPAFDAAVRAVRSLTVIDGVVVVATAPGAFASVVAAADVAARTARRDFSSIDWHVLQPSPLADIFGAKAANLPPESGRYPDSARTVFGDLGANTHAWRALMSRDAVASGAATVVRLAEATEGHPHAVREFFEFCADVNSFGESSSRRRSRKAERGHKDARSGLIASLSGLAGGTREGECLARVDAAVLGAAGMQPSVREALATLEVPPASILRGLVALTPLRELATASTASLTVAPLHARIGGACALVSRLASDIAVERLLEVSCQSMAARRDSHETAAKAAETEVLVAAAAAMYAAIRRLREPTRAIAPPLAAAGSDGGEGATSLTITEEITLADPSVDDDDDDSDGGAAGGGGCYCVSAGGGVACLDFEACGIGEALPDTPGHHQETKKTEPSKPRTATTLTTAGKGFETVIFNLLAASVAAAGPAALLQHGFRHVGAELAAELPMLVPDPVLAMDGLAAECDQPFPGTFGARGVHIADDAFFDAVRAVGAPTSPNRRGALAILPANPFNLAADFAFVFPRRQRSGGGRIVLFVQIKEWAELRSQPLLKSNTNHHQLHSDKKTKNADAVVADRSSTTHVLASYRYGRQFLFDSRVCSQRQGGAGVKDNGFPAALHDACFGHGPTKVFTTLVTSATMPALWSDLSLEFKSANLSRFNLRPPAPTVFDHASPHSPFQPVMLPDEAVADLGSLGAVAPTFTRAAAWALQRRRVERCIPTDV